MLETCVFSCGSILSAQTKTGSDAADLLSDLTSWCCLNVSFDSRDGNIRPCELVSSRQEMAIPKEVNAPEESHWYDTHMPCACSV